MTSPLLHSYQAGQLPHAVLLVTDPATAQSMLDELIHKLQLNPADYLLFNEPVAIKVADARRIRQFSEMTRFTSPIKLIGLTDASQLTIEAGNALLKTLEEPPAGTHFILAANQPDSLLPTIRSRCHLIYVGNRTSSSESDIAPLTKLSLPEAFELSKKLATGDTPLPTIFEHWLATTSKSEWQNRILDYLPLAQTPVNRRLLLDNFFLDLYNSQ